MSLFKGLTTIIETTCQAYRFGAPERLSKEQMAVLIRHLDHGARTADTVLGGRSRPQNVDLPGYGPVVIKSYQRGGIIRYFNRRTHLRWGLSRPRAEFEMLISVRKMGVSAPEPVAFITRGHLFYHGWLVTRRIDTARTLADLCRSDPSVAKAALSEISRQVSLLTAHRILHTDLHPGNVLVGPDAGVHLIDFDKTRTGIGNRSKLRRRYRQRWHRAVVKYQLPDWLDGAMEFD